MKISREQARALRTVPIYPYPHAPLPDGSHPIRTITYANVEQDVWDDPEVVHMVVAHGAWGGPTSFGPLVRQALRAAGVAKQPATATMYSDPQLGFGRYAQAHRTERYDKVVQAQAERVGGPVHLVAHSWNAAGSLEVAAKAAKQEQAASWVGYTPANRIAQDDISFGQFAKGGWVELRNRRAISGLESFVAAGAVVLGVAMHGLLAPRIATAEATRAFNTRITDDLVALEATLPLGVVLAGKDPFFGHGSEAAEQLRQSGFRGAIGIMEGVTHGGATANFRLGGIALYSVVDAVLRPEASSNSDYYLNGTLL
jgi:hypothetical protein